MNQPTISTDYLDCVAHRIRPGDVLVEYPDIETPTMAGEIEENPFTEESSLETDTQTDEKPTFHTVIDIYTETQKGVMVCSDGNLTNQRFINRHDLIDRLANDIYFHWRLLAKEETTVTSRVNGEADTFGFYAFAADSRHLTTSSLLIGYGEFNPNGFNHVGNIDEWGVFNQLSWGSEEFFKKLEIVMQQHPPLNNTVPSLIENAIHESLSRHHE